ncbi:MAG: nickel pincer cofactor biosynthesis protein LarB [Candidatus Gastranaerophilaceae bacterium]
MDKYNDLDFAKIDIDRTSRRGFAESVFCECKTIDKLIGIFEAFQKTETNVLGTRASSEQFIELKKHFGENLHYNPQAKTLKLILNKIEKIGEIAVCTGGTGDIPVAEEAAETAEFFGSNVKKYYDIGISGIHRLFDKMDEIKKANVIIAVAGMEGALGSVITGMVDVPVISVPTSIGYGTSFNGLSALLTMLNSCAEGMTVVNIDNGFNAGYSANQINRLIVKGKK